jgi:hypothetical protein
MKGYTMYKKSIVTLFALANLTLNSLNANELYYTPKIVDLAEDSSTYDVNLYNSKKLPVKGDLTVTNRTIALNIIKANSKSFLTNNNFFFKLYNYKLESNNYTFLKLGFTNFFIENLYYKELSKVPYLGIGYMTDGFYRNKSYFSLSIGGYANDNTYFIGNLGATIKRVGNSKFLNLKDDIGINIGALLGKSYHQYVLTLKNTLYSGDNFKFSVLGAFRSNSNTVGTEYYINGNNNIPFLWKMYSNKKYMLISNLEFKVFKYKSTTFSLYGSFQKRDKNFYEAGLKVSF